MRRQNRSDLKTLRDEVRAIELLAEDTEVQPNRIEDYWAASADLITLIAAFDELEQGTPEVVDDDPRLLDLRRRLRTIAARLIDLAVE